MKTFITFDIDGTLIKFGGESAKHPLAFRNAFNELFHMNIQEYPLQYIQKNVYGMTDLQTLIEMMHKANIQPTDKVVADFQKTVEKQYLSIIQPNFNLVPKAEIFLKTLASNTNLTLAVATGNFEKLAWTKLTLSKLDKYFPLHIGGYGNVMNRSEVIKKALEDAYSKKAGPFDRFIHFGDTSCDAKSALEVGFESVIVKTGKEKSNFPEGSIVFEDFDTDYSKILDFLKIL